MDSYRRACILLGPLTGGLGDDLHRIPEARVTVWLAGIACVLLAIACSNVAGLLLLRAMRVHQYYSTKAIDVPRS